MRFPTATKSPYLIAGAPMFETIERAGSYAASLGTLVGLAWVDRARRETDLRSRPIVSDEVPRRLE